MKEKSQIEKKPKKSRRNCCLPHWAGHRTPAAIGSTYRARDFPGSIRKGSRPARSMPSLWPCIRTITDARPTCSRFTVKPRHGGLRYGSMSRAYRSCSITGTSMSTGTIRMKPSTVPPISNWTKSRRHSSRVSTTEKSARFQYRPDDVALRGQAGLRGCGKAGRQCSGKRICRGGQPQVAHSVQRLSIEDAGQPRSRALGR